MEELASAIVNLVALVLAGVIALVGAQLARKFGFQVTAEQQDLWNTWAQKGILIAEETATARVKAGLGKLTSKEKEAIATDFLVRHLPARAQSAVGNLIKANMPIVRAATMDFATAAVKKATTKAAKKR